MFPVSRTGACRPCGSPGRHDVSRRRHAQTRHRSRWRLRRRVGARPLAPPARARCRSARVAISSMPIGPRARPARNWRMIGLSVVDHLLLGGEPHQAGAEQDAHVVGGAHHRRDVVGDDEEGGAGLLLDVDAPARRGRRRGPGRGRSRARRTARSRGPSPAPGPGRPASSCRRTPRRGTSSGGRAGRPSPAFSRTISRISLSLLLGVLAQREGDVVEQVHRPEQGAVLEQHAELAPDPVEVLLAACRRSARRRPRSRPRPGAAGR